MLWFPLAFGAAILWSFGLILLKKGFLHVPPLWTNILDKGLSLFILIPAALILNGFRVTLPRPPVFGIIFITSPLYLFWLYAISKGQISLTGTIVAGYPLFTVLLSFFFLGEHLNIVQYAGIALILTGDVIVAMPDKISSGSLRSSERTRRDYAWVLWGLVGAVTLGIGDFLSKFSINRIGAHSHLFWLSIISNFVVSINYLIDKPNRPLPPLFGRSGLYAILGLVVNLFGALLFFLAFDYGEVSLIAPVSSVYPAFTALMAVRFLHEKISFRHGMGIGLAILGLILIGMGML
jgi:transporter family protein